MGRASGSMGPRKTACNASAFSWPGRQTWRMSRPLQHAPEVKSSMLLHLLHPNRRRYTCLIANRRLSRKQARGMDHIEFG